MLKLKKGAASCVMPRELWFALGVAHAMHTMYMTPDVVVTDFEKQLLADGGPDNWQNVVKLRTRDLREFDQQHWQAVVTRQLEPMGFEVTRDAQHLMIEFRTAKAERVRATEGGNECHETANARS